MTLELLWEHDGLIGGTLPEELESFYGTTHQELRTTIKEIRTSRVAFKFASSTRVPFDDRDVVMSVDDISKPIR